MWVESHKSGFRIRDRVAGRIITLSSGYDTKTAAKHAATLMKADALKGDALVPRGGERTVAEFCAQWWEDRGVTYTRIRSNESISGVMDRYIVRLLGDVKLKDLVETPAIVQRWVNDLSAGRTQPTRGLPRKLAPKTVRNAHGLLHQLMDAAVQLRLIRSNPCANTRLPDEDESEMWFLTPAEGDRLVAAFDPHWRPMILFLLATGCRWSEMIGLRAKNLDIIDRRVRILRKTVEDRTGQFHDEDPKSKRGRRTLRFPVRVAEALAPLAVADEDRERRIFLGPRAGMIRHKDFYPIWHASCDRAGLKGLRIHDLRHTHVAWLIAANVPLSAISRRLGHKSIAVTDGTYGHLLEEVDDRLVASLEAAMMVIDMGEDGGADGGATAGTSVHRGEPRGTSVAAQEARKPLTSTP